MKKYTVSINVSGKFQPKSMQPVGRVSAKNKADAVKLVYEAFWGRDNDAVIYTDMSEMVGPKTKTKLVATID